MREKRNQIKIEEIRPEELLHGQKMAYQEDVARYKNNQASFRNRNCPGCGSKSGTFFSLHEGFRFTRCAACFSVFMNPGPTEEIVADLYANSSNYAYWADVIYPTTRDVRRKTLHKDRALFALNAVGKIASDSEFRVLELGAGTGDSMAVLREEADFEILGYAIEPNPSMWESLKANGLNIVTDFDQLAGQEFDLIVAYEVMEHILDPRSFVKKYSELLSDRGSFLFSTPNAHSLEVQILRDKSTTLDIEHISVLTPAAIHSISAFAGLEVVEITTPGNFDLELIGNENTWLRESFEDNRIGEFQEIIRKVCFSSHMKAVLKRIE